MSIGILEEDVPQVRRDRWTAAGHSFVRYRKNGEGYLIFVECGSVASTDRFAAMTHPSPPKSHRRAGEWRTMSNPTREGWHGAIMTGTGRVLEAAKVDAYMTYHFWLPLRPSVDAPPSDDTIPLGFLTDGVWERCAHRNMKQVLRSLCGPVYIHADASIGWRVPVKPDEDTLKLVEQGYEWSTIGDGPNLVLKDPNGKNCGQVFGTGHPRDIGWAAWRAYPKGRVHTIAEGPETGRAGVQSVSRAILGAVPVVTREAESTAERDNRLAREALARGGIVLRPDQPVHAAINRLLFEMKEQNR